MDHYPSVATEEFSECMEVYPNGTPWTVPVIRRYSIPCPTVLPRIVLAEINFLIVSVLAYTLHWRVTLCGHITLY